MTAIAKAFTDAGYLTPEDKLRDHALEAAKASPANWEGARDALYRLIKCDADVLWLMLAPYRAQVADAALRAVMQEVRQHEVRVAPVTMAVRSTSEKTWTPDDIVVCVPMLKSPTTQPGKTQRFLAKVVPTLQQQRVAMESRSAIVCLSLLDTFKVNEQPIGDVTPREANGWTLARERDVRWVRLLTQNLPEDLPIRKYRTGQEAAELYTLAESSE